jgi:hypothetical protein
MKTTRTALLVLTIAGMAGCASPQNSSVAVSASGEVQPGVYGRVDVRNRPMPPLVFPDPTIVAPLTREAEPVYLHVPPGQVQRWAMYCHRYHACELPVYFVKSAEFEADAARAKKGMSADDRRYRKP